jgi:hypothetical protein
MVATCLVSALTVIATAGASQLQATASSRSGGPPSNRKLVPPPGGYGAFCGGAPDCPPGHVPSSLRRPLRLPALGAHARCPVSAPGKTVSPDFAPAIGDGPLYAISLFSLAQTGILPFDYPPRPNGLFAGSSWGGQVLKWLGDPSYGGPVLIRGRRLYDRYPLGFGSGTFLRTTKCSYRPAKATQTLAGGVVGPAMPVFDARVAMGCKSTERISARSSSSRLSSTATLGNNKDTSPRLPLLSRPRHATELCR